MTDTMMELERLIGFSIERAIIPLELNEAHDETFSYRLCQRFYNKDEELKQAILLGKQALGELRNAGSRKVGLMYSLIGNMYYILGDFNTSAGYSLRSLSYQQSDITPLIELLFSLRAIGEFELFDDAMFNFSQVYKQLHENKGDLGQQEFCRIVKQVSR